jgi:hypothetical protein
MDYSIDTGVGALGLLKANPKEYEKAKGRWKEELRVSICPPLLLNSTHCYGPRLPVSVRMHPC